MSEQEQSWQCPNFESPDEVKHGFVKRCIDQGITWYRESNRSTSLTRAMDILAGKTGGKVSTKWANFTTGDLKRVLLFLALLEASALAQVNNPPNHIVGTQIGVNLPAAASAPNQFWMIYNGASSSDCVTGGGTTAVLCYSNGSSWTAVSGGSGTFVPLSGDATSTATGGATEVVGLLNHLLPSLTTGYLNWTGSAWALSAGGSGDTITSPNSTLNVGGSSSATTLDLAGSAGEIMAGATPALTYTPTFGKSGTAGTLALFPATGNFTTTLGSAATASNTIDFFATVPTNLDLFYCAVSSTTCTLTDTGYAYNSIPNADLAHSSTAVNGQTCTLGSTCAVESATSGQVAISGGAGFALTGAADLTYSTHTFATVSTGIFDFSAATGTAAFKVPSTTTNTASAAGVIDYDSTNSNYHAYSGADSLIGVVPTASVPTTGHVIDALVSASKFLLHDSGITTANVVNASSPGVGIAHFAGSTQTVTSSTIATGDIANNAVTLAKLATQAANTVLANVTSGSAVPTAAAIPSGMQFYTAGTGYSTVTGAQWLSGAGNQTANTVLGALTATTPSDLAVPSCSSASNALTWTSGTGFGCNTISGSGTVTSVSVTTANGVSGTVATATTTPAISLTLGAITPSSVAATGAISGATIATATKCAAAGSGASPSLVACSAAPAGLFSCATNASGATCVISTTAVTASSVIQVQPDSSLGSALSVTCNTTADSGLTAPRVSARSAGTSFTIALGTFTTNPECFSYIVVN